MKSPRPNRFRPGARGHAQRLPPPGLGHGLPVIDVDGLVVREASRAVRLTMLGQTVPVDEDGRTVILGGRKFRLEKIQGRDTLVALP